jgi:hypothetical protein
VRLDELHEIVDELLTLEVAHLAQRDAAAEVFIAVRVATGTTERALTGDFDRESWTVASQDPSPSSKDAFHRGDYTIAIAAGGSWPRAQVLAAVGFTRRISS